MKAFGYKEMKNQHDAGHMTKMATMPIYGKKHFINLLLQNQLTDFQENWYVALGIQGHIIVCSNYDPSLTLTYFSARSNLVI